MSEVSVADGVAPLRIARVVRETSDAVSLVLDVPPDSVHRFRYRAGQFLTLHVNVDGRDLRRCYSMSSAPADAELQITVKRDPGGVVSNWINDSATEGDHVNATPPEGKFVLAEDLSVDRPLIAFAGGSGITPIMSLIRTALADTGRTVKVFYANRGRASVIFSKSLSSLVGEHPDRLTVTHHYDEDDGVVSAAAVTAFVTAVADADFYVCGPAPFMDTVEAALGGHGVPRQRVHLERFSVADVPPGVTDDTAEACEEVVIELDRTKVTAAYRDGDTLLQTARQKGLRAPSSCETGSCGTCMARIVEGSAQMRINDALDEDEVEEGWVLTCQSLPTSRKVHLIYD